MMENRLTFHKNGHFRILCVSDIHGGKGFDAENTVKYLTSLLDKTNPDLVLLLGDVAGPGVIHIENAGQLRNMLFALTGVLEARGIYWAQVFGNHDDNFGLSNRDAQRVYNEFPHCLSVHGEELLMGSGNYCLKLYDHTGENLLYHIFAFDSHRGMDGFAEDYHRQKDFETRLSDLGGVDSGERGTDFAQVMWYYTLSREAEKLYGRVIPALAVQHVPLFEMALASLNPKECSLQGKFGEKVSCQRINSGLFRAALERGDIRDFCFGHDHDNNFTLSYCGIRMSYDGYLSCHASHDFKLLGGRIYDLTQNDGSIAVETEFVSAL